MLESQIHRTPDTEPIRAWLGKPVIKVLIGMRRTGKSFLLRQPAAEVAAAGMPLERIHFSRLAHEAPGLRRFLAGEPLHASGWA